MEDTERNDERGLEADADLQALEYVHNQEDVMDLFDTLKGKLRPGFTISDAGVLGETAKASSGRSTLHVHYNGSVGNTVLSKANLKRIHDFLNEPQKHLDQVIADIKKEAGDFYRKVGPSGHPKNTETTLHVHSRRSVDPLVKHGKRTCLEDVPEMNKYLGPSSRFGDGDGSFWDRWLTTTGYFTNEGTYAKADIPTRSMYATGTVPPISGFKRFQLDKLAFPRNPDPRVLTYVKRRELGDKIDDTGKPKRLRGAHPERCLSSASVEWPDELPVTDNNGNSKETVDSNDLLRAKVELTGTLPSPSNSKNGEAQGDTVNNERSDSLSTTMEERVEINDAASAALESVQRNSSGGDSKDEEISRRRISIGMEDPLKIDIIYPKYFGKRARTHLYEYFKQVTRRKHRFGEKHDMSFTSLSSADHKGDACSDDYGLKGLVESDSQADFAGRAESTRRTKLLLPRLTKVAREGAAGDFDNSGEQEGGDEMTRTDDPGDLQVTSRTRYLVRCTEENVPPRANIIIRKTRTTKVNLAHQGMGDVMARILADCLVGMPLMRELNLRDNRLTDKGLMPIVKAIKQRHDLYALDLSENKLDRWAARQLALYFSDPETTLAKFVLSKADVDDFEASNFVKNMRQNKTLTYLDISHNLIGSQESINYVQPEFYTGAEALADWISMETCPLKYLDVSWNTIRLNSAVCFGKAIAHASHLEELDLSFNCFGAKGGEAIGASLHINTSLKKLGLESNAINPRACFVIGQGLLCNPNIRSINLSNNALGKVGLGCMAALTTEVGDMIEIQLAHCNFMMECKDCWFDDAKLKPSYELQLGEPYDRAVALHLVRRAAKDERLKLKPVAHALLGEAEKEVKLVRSIAQSRRSFPGRPLREEIFRMYDKSASGSLGRDELAMALENLELGGAKKADQAIVHHGDENGRVGEQDFHDFVEKSIRHYKEREGRCQGFLAEEAKPGTRWVVPLEGKLRLKLEYSLLQNQGCHTSMEGTDSFASMLMGIGDGVTEVITHALDYVSLDIEQGLRVYSAVLKLLGGDKIKALTKVIPRIELPNDARFLKNTILRGIDERRRLRRKLGPAYRPLMGTPMGSYELNMTKPMHCLAARKILECNHLEKLKRQTGPPLVFDASQKGDWENIRNEFMDGKPSRIKREIMEAPITGTLTMDYVSTAQRPVKIREGRKFPPDVMSTRRFHEMLRLAGLCEDAAWPEHVSEEDFDRAIDEDLSEFPPQPRTPTLFEHLRILTMDADTQGARAPSSSRPTTMDKKPHPREHKQTDHKPKAQCGIRLKTLNFLQRRRRSSGKATRMVDAGLFAMSCRLDELMADRWLSIRQCRFILLAVEEMFSGEEALQDYIADFVVTVYPRIVSSSFRPCTFAFHLSKVDVHDYMTLLACIEDKTAASVIKRIGWLAAWNPCRPDGYIELTLRRREDRQVAKMLAHLLVEERDESWASASFRWAMHEPPTPGWMLPMAWYTENDMPHKGILTVEYRSGSRINWVLRMALARTVTICDVFPGAALGIVDNKCHPHDERGGTGTSARRKTRENRHSAVGEGAMALDPAFLERPFDRDFVDALSRQATRNFSFYGT